MKHRLASALILAIGFPGVSHSASQTELRSQLIALAAGSYSGECIEAMKDVPLAGTLTLLRNGRLTAPGLTYDLSTDKTTIAFNREFNGSGAATEASFRAYEKGPTHFTMELSSRERQDDNVAAAMMFLKPGAGPEPKLGGIRCHNSPQTTPLRAANATTFAMQLILSAKRKLRCAHADSFVATDYQVTNLQVSLGATVIALSSGLKTETITMTDAGLFAYSAQFLDGREVGITLDKNRALMGVSVRKSAAGDETMCLV